MELKEYFSQSMPDWLRKAFKTHYDSENGNFYKSPGNLFRAAVGAKKQDPITLDKYADTFGANINLANAKFIVDNNFPTKPSDPRLNAPNIPFIHVEVERPADGYRGKQGELTVMDQVWAKGLNDKDLFLVNPSDNTWSTRGSGNRSFEYQNLKKLTPYIVDFCYVDMSDPKNSVKDIRNERKNSRNNRTNIRGRGQWGRIEKDRVRDYDSNGNFIGTHYENPHMVYSQERNQDKSGYTLPDPQKYVKKLISLKRDNYAEQLEKYYEEIIDLKAELQRLENATDFRTYKNYKRTFNRLNDDVYECIDHYTNMLDELEQAKRNTERYRDKCAMRGQNSDDIINGFLDAMFSVDSELSKNAYCGYTAKRMEEKIKSTHKQLELAKQNIKDYFDNLNDNTGDEM